MKLIISILTVFLGATSFSEISDPEGVFIAANEAYDSTNYKEANDLYTILLDEGYKGKELYFNFGNTNFKLGNLALSILYYEKALKISPNWDKPIKNLAIARKSLTDKHEQTRLGFSQWISGFVGFTTDFWAWMSILCLLVAFIAFIGYKKLNSDLMRKVTKAKFIGFSVLFFLLVGVSIIKYHVERSSSAAIITSSSVTLKSDPSITSESIFVLHEGSKMVILAQEDNWLKVRFGSQEGWLEESSLSYI